MSATTAATPATTTPTATATRAAGATVGLVESSTPAQSWVSRLRPLLWPNLPTLLVGSAAVSAVGGVVMVLVPGITPLSLLLWAVLAGPVFSALVAQANDIVLGGDVGTFSIGTYLRRAGRLGLGLALPAAVAGSCSIVALEVWQQTGSPFALVSTAVGAVTAVLLIVAAITALPIGLERPRLRGIALPLTALHIAARRPVPVFGVAALLVAGVSAAVQVAASIIFLIPGPLALVLVTAVWTAADASGLRPRELGD